MSIDNGPDMEYQFLDCLHEINVSTEPINLLNKMILKYFVFCYFSFNDIILLITFCVMFCLMIYNIFCFSLCSGIVWPFSVCRRIAVVVFGKDVC